uniref:Pentacotripeptide-repeat region of PRORP domain-containing protein n=2 Tax=Rhodosorus marinus TaxID=101924 RepID=A0A7S2ZT63_9RHOD|mmetsp:Transcript_31765/g.123203  ORF Transcript_31765/g.123203 Transcript_31765/m.123203 type:complete len:492 (+) Transcript_31765:290-1765(+)
MLRFIGPGGRLIVYNRARGACASLSTVSEAADDGRYIIRSPRIEQNRELTSELTRTRLKIVQGLKDQRNANDPKFIHAALAAWFGADQSPTEVELIAACERLTSEGVRLGITLLREIVKQFKGNIESLAAALKKSTQSMSEANKAVNTLIIALVDCGRRDEAFLVAENCAYVTGFARQKLDRQDPDYDQESRGLEKSIINHLEIGNMEAASMDLRKMDRLRQGPSDNVLADLSWAYLHRGRKLDAMQLFKRIKTTRMPLLISLMSKFSAERNLPACKELFSFSKNNPRAVDILVEVLLYSGETNEARRLLDSLSNGKIPPSGRSFGRVIVKLCKANDLEGAYGVFLNMRSLQLHDPNAYVSLSGLLRRRHRIEDAFKLSDELMRIYPSSTFSYNCLLDNLLASNNPIQHRRALRVFEEMERREIPLTDSVYAAVIKAHGKLHNKTECYRFMEEASKAIGIPVPIASFNSFLFALGEMGAPEGSTFSVAPLK